MPFIPSSTPPIAGVTPVSPPTPVASGDGFAALFGAVGKDAAAAGGKVLPEVPGADAGEVAAAPSSAAAPTIEPVFTGTAPVTPELPRPRDRHADARHFPPGPSPVILTAIVDERGEVAPAAERDDTASPFERVDPTVTQPSPIHPSAPEDVRWPEPQPQSDPDQQQTPEPATPIPLTTAMQSPVEPRPMRSPKAATVALAPSVTAALSEPRTDAPQAVTAASPSLTEPVAVRLDTRTPSRPVAPSRSGARALFLPGARLDVEASFSPTPTIPHAVAEASHLGQIAASSQHATRPARSGMAPSMIAVAPSDVVRDIPADSTSTQSTAAHIAAAVVRLVEPPANDTRVEPRPPTASPSLSTSRGLANLSAAPAKPGVPSDVSVTAKPSIVGNDLPPVGVIPVASPMIATRSALRPAVVTAAFTTPLVASRGAAQPTIGATIATPHVVPAPVPAAAPSDLPTLAPQDRAPAAGPERADAATPRPIATARTNAPVPITPALPPPATMEPTSNSDVQPASQATSAPGASFGAEHVDSASVATPVPPSLDTAAQLARRPVIARAGPVRTVASDEPSMTTANPLATPLADPAPAGALASRQPPVDMTRDTWPTAMIDRIERLRDAADAVSTSIRVIPDALGAIDVSVRREGEVTHVRLAAEQPQTRALLADAQPKLAEIAEQRGLRLGQAEIGGGSTPGGGGQPAPQQHAGGPSTASSHAPSRPRAEARASTTQDGRIA